MICRLYGDTGARVPLRGGIVDKMQSVDVKK